MLRLTVCVIVSDNENEKKLVVQLVCELVSVLCFCYVAVCEVGGDDERLPRERW